MMVVVDFFGGVVVGRAEAQALVLPFGLFNLKFGRHWSGVRSGLVWSNVSGA